MKDQGLVPSMLKTGSSIMGKFTDLPDDSGLDDTHLSLSAIVDAFVEEHDSYCYQIAPAAERPQSQYRTKQWIRDGTQRGVDNPQGSNDKPSKNRGDSTNFIYLRQSTDSSESPNDKPSGSHGDSTNFTYLRRNRTPGNTRKAPVPESQNAEMSELMQDPDDEKSIFATAFNIFYKDRRIFRTKERNFLGTGPSTVKKGDIVMLVAGLEVPYIFRDAGDGSGRLTLIGTSYVHGAMYGELLASDGVEFNSWFVA